MKKNTPCRRIIALLTALLLLCGTLSACGEEEQAAQITLRTISVMGDDGIKEAYSALLEDFSARYPHVYHIGTVAGSGNAYKLDALFADTYNDSRYPHAVYYYTNTGMNDLTEYFVPIDEIRMTYPDFASGISDAALRSVNADDGVAYCVPFAGRWTTLAVNRSMLNRFDVQMPETWQQLLTVCGILSARGITPIANSPDDCAALMELMCVNGGAQHALNSVLGSEDPLPLRVDREALLEVFRRYEELCGISSFPDPVITDDLRDAIDLASAVSGSDIPSGSDAVTGSLLRRDPVDMFNSGEAAMVILDSSQFGRITLNNCVLLQFPVCDLSGESPQTMVGGYETGWYITRRAYNDKAIRDTVVAFVDAMTGSKACAEFSALGYLPSGTVSEVSFTDTAGLVDLASDVDTFVSTTINSVNSGRYARLEMIASAICLDLITPEQGVELASDLSLKLTDVMEQPEPEPQPQPTVSDTDVPAEKDGGLG
ncbi:MAG: carbohydrate ABC transporter substrate-binding protein [Ruminococcaceae bacterium]|nr:carbohydrate ABC transporter substrate-binding protein [Oscillospiraceae bacterium]